MKQILQKYSPPFLILIILVLVLYPTLSGGKTLFYRDIFMQDYPLIDFVVNTIKNGNFPWWNNLIFSGIPQAASLQPPVFYPGALVYLLFPFPVALSVSLILHFFLAGFGVYLIGLNWNLKRSSALTGAVVFALNGYMIELHTFQYIAWAVAWMPYIFLYTEKFIEKSSIKNFLLLVVFLSLLLATGRLDYFYFTILFLVPWVIYLFKKEKKRKDRVQISLYLGAGFILALGLLAIQVIPSLEYVKTTLRSGGFSFDFSTNWSMNPWQLIQLVFNNFFGSLFYYKGIFNLIMDIKNPGFFVYNLSVGILSLFLAGFAIYKKVPRAIFLGILILIFTFISFGRYTPLYSLFYYLLPGFSIFRYPAKFFIISLFFLSLLVSLGAEVINIPENRKKFNTIVLSVIGIYIVILLIAYAFSESITGYINQLLSSSGAYIPNISFIFETMKLPLLILLIFAASVYLIEKKSTDFKYYPCLVILLITFELTNYIVADLWVVPTEQLYQRSEIAADIIKKNFDKNLFYFLNSMEGKVFYKEEAISPALYDFQQNILSMTFNLSMTYGLKNASGYLPTPPTGIYKIISLVNSPGLTVPPWKKAELLKLMAVKFYIYYPPEDKTGFSPEAYFTLVNQYPETSIELWQVDSLPVYNFKTEKMVADQDTILKVMAGMEQPDMDISKIVLIENNADYKLALDRDKDTSDPNIKEKITLENESGNSIDIYAEVPQTGYLVLAKNYDKGWKAYDNGIESPVLKVNYYQQAVRISSGKHKIKFIYRPLSFTIGAVISILALLVFIGLIFFNKFRIGKVKAG